MIREVCLQGNLKDQFLGRDPRCIARLGLSISGTGRLCPEVSRIPVPSWAPDDQLCGLRSADSAPEGFRVFPFGPIGNCI